VLYRMVTLLVTLSDP